MVFRTLVITLAVFGSAIGFECPEKPSGNNLPMCTEDFRIDSVSISEIPNEYFSLADISINPGNLSSTTIVNITKDLPEDLVLKICLNYQDQDVPCIEFPVCPGMSDPIFVDDVVSIGLPKETFPRSCPILAGYYKVPCWHHRCDKIPPGTPPGPVIVKVFLIIQSTGQVIFHLFSIGAVVLKELVNAALPKIPLGK